MREQIERCAAARMTCARCLHLKIAALSIRLRTLAIVNEAQAASGAAALLPAIPGGFKKQAQSQASGVEGLGGGGLLDNVLSPQPTNMNLGNDVLGQIFGSKDVSRAVAQNVAPQSGLDPSLLKKMLPMLAMIVAGYMAKQRSAGTVTQSSSPTGGGLAGMLGGLLGGQPGATGNANSGFASMLDLNRDGNPLDDILGMAGKAFR